MSQLQVLMILSIFLALSSKIIFANAEWEVACDPNTKNIVADKRTKEIQNQCFKDYHLTAENATCVVRCMFVKGNMTDADGKPNKEKFEKYCDEAIDPNIRANIKNITCFENHAANTVMKDDSMCQNSKDFDACVNGEMQKLCK